MKARDRFAIWFGKVNSEQTWDKIIVWGIAFALTCIYLKALAE